MRGNQLLVSGGGSPTETCDIFGDGSGLALYQLNGDANDTCGVYNGTATNISWGGTGIVETAASFNGTSSFIQASNGWGILGSSVSFGFSVWINSSSFSGQRTVISLGGMTGGRHYRVFLGSSNSLGLDSLNAGIFYFPSMVTLSTGTWYHLVVTQDGVANTAYAWINGSSVGSVGFNPNPGGSLYNGAIGTRNYPYEDYWWSGSIDQVRVFNRLLTQSDVTTLYEEVL